MKATDGATHWLSKHHVVRRVEPVLPHRIPLELAAHELAKLERLIGVLGLFDAIPALPS